MKNIKLFRIVFPSVALAIMVFSCNLFVKSLSHNSYNDCKMEKVNFDISMLDENGLVGQTDGKVSLDFEFCIPKNDSFIDKVFAIDSTFSKQIASGRSLCKNDHLLIIGNTHNKNYKKILCELSKLEFVNEINISYKE